VTQETDYQIYKDLLRESLTKYTRKAFKMIPKLDKPCILDAGCGSVVPTMELAGLSNGEIAGLDVNQPLLDRLARKMEKAVFSERHAAPETLLFGEGTEHSDELLDHTAMNC
jgi:ubiquinone/menaquinone biosynthesis C-methylase UbiE